MSGSIAGTRRVVCTLVSETRRRPAAVRTKRRRARARARAHTFRSIHALVKTLARMRRACNSFRACARAASASPRRNKSDIMSVLTKRELNSYSLLGASHFERAGAPLKLFRNYPYIIKRTLSNIRKMIV